MPLKRAAAFMLALVISLAMQGAALAQARPVAAQPSAQGASLSRTMSVGCRGEDVKALQLRLNELGYFLGEANGVFGRDTLDAVKAFQLDFGFKPDGIVGPGTYDAIFGAGNAAVAMAPMQPVYAFGKMDNQITLRQGRSGSNVRDLQSALALKGFYKGKISGSFDVRTKAAVMSFQRSVGLKSDGKAGNYTLSALYTMLYPPDLASLAPCPSVMMVCAGIPVEKLEWSFVAKEVFNRGMDAVVVDVRTGYAFSVRRTGGTRHADVETLTPLDTAVFHKSAGNFSWARRPIWVLVGGRRLAASMNCMPHGYDTMPGNDFKGQFCIHFVGSRTHDKNKTDPEHQACIEEAYQAGLMLPPTATPPLSPEPSATPVSDTSN
jgi:peptidoglycan hydrolase-like protein with peptidoglycan-binding domain